MMGIATWEDCQQKRNKLKQKADQQSLIFGLEIFVKHSII